MKKKRESNHHLSPSSLSLESFFLHPLRKIEHRFYNAIEYISSTRPSLEMSETNETCVAYRSWTAHRRCTLATTPCVSQVGGRVSGRRWQLDRINIHQRPMFGWLKFVGLAGNFASLPPRFYASVALACTERADLTKYDEDGQRV